jgi:hypothetical protein
MHAVGKHYFTFNQPPAENENEELQQFFKLLPAMVS